MEIKERRVAVGVSRAGVGKGEGRWGERANRPPSWAGPALGLQGSQL